MFYEAMLCSGVNVGQARTMYAGVMLGGPKWSENAISNSNLASGQRQLASKSRGKFDIAAMADAVQTRGAHEGRVQAFAIDLKVRPERILAALTQAKLGNKPGKPALHYRPSRAKAERVALAAASLDLDAIDEMIEHETKGLKLVPANL